MTPLVIAHRGACWNAPENTLEAFELAIEEGADYVEFDVRDRDGELIFLSFFADALDAVLRLQPGVRTGLHLGRGPDPSRGMRFWGVGFGEPAHPEPIRQAQSLGLATLVFTVNEPARMRELAELGVTGIFSDRPGLLRETLASLPGPERERSRPETSR